MNKDKNKVTAKELYDKVFNDYDSSKEESRIHKIFDQESEFNKRLIKFGELVKKHVPDLEEELKKLGFCNHEILYHHYFVNPDRTDYYSDNEGNNIKIENGYGSLVVDFNGTLKIFESIYLGENEREFLDWIKQND